MGMCEDIRRSFMNAFELSRNSRQARIFSIDRGIAIREDETGNAEEFACSFGRLLSTLMRLPSSPGISCSTGYKLIECG